MAQAQKTRTSQNQAISLKGSTKMVTEFFEYSVNSILYQRNIYPPEEFKMVKKYGIPMLITCDEELTAYLRKILKQVQEWLMSSTITRLVLAITSKETLETLERWQFDIIKEDESPADGDESAGARGADAGGSSSGSGSAQAPASGSTSTSSAPSSSTSLSAKGKAKEKTEKEVQAEIREIMKQITASVTFLPVLEEECTFTLLAYTSTAEPLPVTEEWNDADPHLIDKGKVEQVRLRSFSTNVHKLEAMVAYKVGE